MKPDWKDAPEWANWLAMDENGVWVWFEAEPFKDDSGEFNIWRSLKKYKLVNSIGNWEESLEQRPSDTK